MELYVPKNKKLYIIANTPNIQESPSEFRNSLGNYEVDGVYLVYNNGRSGDSGFITSRGDVEFRRFEVFFNALLDLEIEKGIVIEALGSKFSPYSTYTCIDGSKVVGWIHPALVDRYLTFDQRYKRTIDLLEGFVDSNVSILFDHIRYPNPKSGFRSVSSYNQDTCKRMWAANISEVSKVTSILADYLRDLGVRSFSGVLHTPIEYNDNACAKAWNVGQAYDDTVGLTKYIDRVFMLMYYAQREDYLKWMRDLARTGTTLNGFSTRGTSRPLYFLMSVEAPHYWTSNLQEVIDEALQWFEGLVIWDYTSLHRKVTRIDRY